MNKQKLPSQQELNDRFIYKDGQLYVKTLYEHLAKHSSDLFGECPTNTQKPLAQLSNADYQSIWLNNQSVKLHRVIFKMFTGEEPETLDHIDGNTRNNKIENLRPASEAENCRNRKLNKTSSLGIKNVHYVKTKNVFQIYVQKDKKRHYIGSTKCLETAKKMAIQAREELHGEFARHE